MDGPNSSNSAVLPLATAASFRKRKWIGLLRATQAHQRKVW